MALIVNDRENIVKQAKGKDKCKRIFGECYCKKKYLSEARISEIRNWFRTRFGLLCTICRKLFARPTICQDRLEMQMWRCPRAGGAPELGLCSIYGGIRRKYGNLKDEATLVEFFQEVLARREEIMAPPCRSYQPVPQPGDQQTWGRETS